MNSMFAKYRVTKLLDAFQLVGIVCVVSEIVRLSAAELIYRSISPQRTSCRPFLCANLQYRLSFDVGIGTIQKL